MNRFPVAPKNERTIDGITFDSKKEARRYGELKLLQRAGEISDLKCHPSFNVLIACHKFCTYTADFSYHDKRRDTDVIEDVKSTGTKKDAAYRLRKKAAELYHHLKITEYVA